MSMNMQRILGLCMALCLGLVWGCMKVDVSVTSSDTNRLSTHPPPHEKPPISIAELRKRHAAKHAAIRDVCPSSRSIIINEEKQQTVAWCWAASTRLVMEHYNNNKPTVLQCDIVKNIFSLWRTNCCELKVTPDFIYAPSTCVRGGWPYWVFDKYQFEYDIVPGALEWEDLKEEICTNGPFISVINWTEGGKHALIVTGYSETPTKVVTIYDPATKDFLYQDFGDFVGGSLKGSDGVHRFSHNRNYVQLMPKTKDQP